VSKKIPHLGIRIPLWGMTCRGLLRSFLSSREGALVSRFRYCMKRFSAC
jgi:hypothetical protein